MVACEEALAKQEHFIRKLLSNRTVERGIARVVTRGSGVLKSLEIYIMQFSLLSTFHGDIF